MVWKDGLWKRCMWDVNDGKAEKKGFYRAGDVGEEIVVCDLRLLVGFRSFTG